MGGRYKLSELRGGGGMAKVYKAEDLTLQRVVAVKLINPELRTEQEFDARFQREARIASQLQDPHIVAVHDFGIDPTLGPYLVMEYLEGQSLRERLQTGGPLPLKAGLQIGGQLLLALTHAHEKGIIHRDIKPDNVFLVSQSGVRMHVRVLDFGIARILRKDDPNQGHTLTSPGSVLGTPRYMSPEQLAGQPLDARSDLFSASLVIFETLTGQLPYVSGKKLCELCPDASPSLQDLLDHCLKPAPGDRPQTAVEAYLRIQEFAKASGVLLLPPGAIDAILRGRKRNPPAGSPTPTVAYPAPPTAAQKRRRLLLGLAAVVFLFASAAFVKWYFFHTSYPSPGADNSGGPESVLGIHIGDSRDAAENKLGNMHTRRWAQKPDDVPLGHVLHPAGFLPQDLGLSPDKLPDVDVSWTDDKNVVVLYHDEKVRAVIVLEPRAAGTGRGVHIRDDLSVVTDKYDKTGLEPNVNTKTEERNGVKTLQLEIRRYETLGVGFEMHKGKVVGITLFPPVKG